MAINLKEIFEGDSAFIKVEKINYNFDQILANGGGPAGPTGTTGQSGTPGQQGQPGSQGYQGYQGAAGSAGVAGDYWDRDEEYNDGTGVDQTQFHILRPYNYEEAVPNSNSLEWISRVVLGDDNAIDSGSETPQIKPDALLTLVNEANSQHPGIQLEFLSKNPGSSKYFFNTEPSKLSLSTIISSGNGVADISFIANDNFEIKGADINIESAGTDINVDSNNDTIVNSNNESRFNGTELSLVYSPAKAHIWSPAEVMVGEQRQNSGDPETALTRIYGDEIKIGNTSNPSTDTIYELYADSVTETVVNDSSEQIGGDKEIDTTGSNKILAGINNEIQSDVKNEITSVDNEITATSGSNIIQTNNQGNNELKINASNSPGKNILDAGASSNNILRNNSVDNFKTQNGLNTSDETIYFSDSDGDHQGVYNGTSPEEFDNISRGDGVRWKQGGGQLGDPDLYPSTGVYQAMNYTTHDWQRTMADYFLEDSLTGSSAPSFVIKDVDGTTGGSVEPAYTSYAGSGAATQPTRFNSHLSYVKTGHLINAWVSGVWVCADDWKGETWEFSTGGPQLCVELNNNNRFSYRHGGDAPVIFDVTITCQGINFTEMANIGTQSGDTEFFGFKGMIHKGSNRVWLYKYLRRNNSGTTQVDDKPWLIPLCPDDIVDKDNNGNWTSHSLAYYFNFQMWAHQKAYDRIEFVNGSSGGSNVGKSTTAESSSIVATFTGPGVSPQSPALRDVQSTYEADETAADTTYQWTVVGGTIDADLGADKQTVKVTWDNAMVQNGTLGLEVTNGSNTETKQETVALATAGGGNNDSTITLSENSLTASSTQTQQITVSQSPNAFGWDATTTGGAMVSASPDSAGGISAGDNSNLNVDVIVYGEAEDTITFTARQNGGTATLTFTSGGKGAA